MQQGGLKHGLTALIVSLAIFGCSDPKNQIFDSNTGKHLSGWLPAQHATYATNGTTSLGAPVPSTGLCSDCHGADLSGGISGVSCTSCHLGGPTSVHPPTWDPIYSTHGPSVSSGATGTALCANQYCHGASLTGVANSGPSCDKNTGTGGCHSIPYDPLTVICGACHRVPPDGAAFPNLAGKHAKHATSNKTSCDICHNGASSYVGDHSNGVIDFSFLAAYTPATGLTPTFNPSAKTCSNISCHGGQTTPSWYAGAIDVNTQCGLCHVAGPFAGSPQYNSYYSGHHSSHLGLGAICTDCHDTTNLTVVHFNDLNTPAMTQANQTILDALNYDGYSCQFTCHINNEQHERGMNW